MPVPSFCSRRPPRRARPWRAVLAPLGVVSLSSGWHKSSSRYSSSIGPKPCSRFRVHARDPASGDAAARAVPSRRLRLEPLEARADARLDGALRRVPHLVFTGTEPRASRVRGQVGWASRSPAPVEIAVPRSETRARRANHMARRSRPENLCGWTPWLRERQKVRPHRRKRRERNALDSFAPSCVG